MNTVTTRVGGRMFHISATARLGGGDPDNAAVLRRSPLDPMAIIQLRSLLVREAGPAFSRLPDKMVIEEAAKRIEAGRWSMAAVEAPAIYHASLGSEPSGKGAGAKGAKDSTKKKTTDWIQVELIGKDKRPIKGVKVVVTLPDGTPQNGTLNDSGAFRLDGIDPGTCKVAFPDLDSREWSKSGQFAEGKSVELFKGPPKLKSGPYTVVQGDHISSIAYDSGFVSWKTIWDDGKNAAIKTKRNPNVLFPGDIIEIPAKQQKEESAPTGDYHVYQTIGDPVQLKIVVLDWAGNPIVNTELDLQIDKNEKIPTAGDGSVSKKIDPSCDKIGKLVVKGYELGLKLGHLDPVEELTGQAWRLNNLGYRAGEPADDQDKAFLSAVEEFQCDNNLTVDGDCGPATQAKLKEVHGS